MREAEGELGRGPVEIAGHYGSGVQLLRQSARATRLADYGPLTPWGSGASSSDRELLSFIFGSRNCVYIAGARR